MTNNLLESFINRLLRSNSKSQLIFFADIFSFEISRRNFFSNIFTVDLSWARTRGWLEIHKPIYLKNFTFEILILLLLSWEKDLDSVFPSFVTVELDFILNFLLPIPPIFIPIEPRSSPPKKSSPRKVLKISFSSFSIPSKISSKSNEVRLCLFVGSFFVLKNSSKSLKNWSKLNSKSDFRCWWWWSVPASANPEAS